MFDNIVFVRHDFDTLPNFRDWYIECRTEVGITYGHGECFGVLVGAEYPTDPKETQPKSWLSELEVSCAA